MRVVFDSNIFISALVFPGKQAEEAVNRVVGGRDELVVSKQIVGEVLIVLARKFAREREELARVAVLLSELGEMVSPGRRIRILNDAADNAILECAVAGRAEAIVTGDRAMLELGAFEGTRVLSLRRYLES